MHNFLWSTLDAAAMQEIYWWRSHISNKSYDHRNEFKRLAAFLADVPLNRGGYADWAGEVDSPELRVVGQKNLAIGRLHLWIQNREHRWTLAPGEKIPAVSGTVVVPGWPPNSSFEVDVIDTYETPVRATRDRIRLQADAAGALRIPVRRLHTDFALKASLQSMRSPTGALDSSR